MLPKLHEAGKTVHGHVVTDPTLTLGVNDRVELAKVRKLAQQRIHDEHGAQRGHDHRSRQHDHRGGGDDRPGHDRGAEHVHPREHDDRRDCTIGPLTTLIDATLGDGVSVPHSYLVRPAVDDFGTIGPFAYLRPDAHLHPKAKAGAFVEIKNSTIGAGTKVPHLSYIGDADIGENTNIGAGNITANYDGKNKHRTTIGSTSGRASTPRSSRRSKSAMAPTPERVALSPRTYRPTRLGSPAPARRTSRTMRSGASSDDRRPPYTPPRRERPVVQNLIGHVTAAQRL